MMGSRRDPDRLPIVGPNELDELKKSIPFPSCRGIMAVVSCLGIVNVYALRVNLSVAVVAMVNSSYSGASNTNVSIDECPGQHLDTNISSTSDGEFNWDNELQGFILGSFFYGYISTQLVGGRLAEAYGTKWLLFGSILSSSALSVLTPFAARWSPYAFIALRVLMGIGEGVSYPVIYVMLAHWAPPLERSRLGTIVWSGANLGTVIAMLLSGIIAVNLGWPWIFYIFGSAGCLWCVAFVFLVYDTPASHPRITPEERTYVEKAIGPHSVRPAVPWKSLLTSGAFWGAALTQICFAWGGYTLLTSLPKYFHDVLHFNLAANGFLSSLPYMLQYIMTMLAGQLADRLISHRILSVTAVRKLFTDVGMLFPAAALLTVSFLGCHQAAAVAVIVVGTGISSVVNSGYITNYLDFAPVFTGTTMGIANTLSNLTGFLGPEVVGWLTNKDPSARQWQKVFFISTGMYLLGIIIYTILASGEEQDWAKPARDEEEIVIQQSPQIRRVAMGSPMMRTRNRHDVTLNRVESPLGSDNLTIQY